ncbi:MAG: hypothetical protein ABR500_04270 [Dermatophilaceae bacterium]|nr:hypothetical protein [Intrasporangiaceae bacterium]
MTHGAQYAVLTGDDQPRVRTLVTPLPRHREGPSSRASPHLLEISSSEGRFCVGYPTK